MIIHHLTPLHQPHNPLSTRRIHIAMARKHRRAPINPTIPPLPIDIRARDADRPAHSNAILFSGRNEVRRGITARADREERKYAP